MHQVRYFIAVADQLNFTRAADRLHVAQPSLTRAIQKLEDELGGPLFRRERANTHLTELGRMMLPHLQASLTAAETAKLQAQSFRKREVGHLVLGAAASVSARIGIALAAAVAAEIPALDLQVEVGANAAIGERLLAGTLDAAILAPTDEEVRPAGHGRFDHRFVAEDGFVVAFGLSHRFAGLDEVTLEDLDGEPLLLRLGCPHEAAIGVAMEARGVSRFVRHKAGDEGWLTEMTRSGLGCVVLPEAVAVACGLDHRRLADLPLRHRVSLTTVAGRRHSPALAALVRHADRMSRSLEATDRVA